MKQSDYLETLNQHLEKASSQDILDYYGITEYTADDIIREFQEAMTYKTEQARIFKILDAADHSDIWKVYNKKIPNYVQTPTTNPITAGTKPHIKRFISNIYDS